MVWLILALIVVAIVLAVVQYYITPKPKAENARPAGLGDFKVPTATEKRSVPVIWGDVIVKGPNVIWYGDLAVTPYRQTEGGNKITLGHFYFLGMDMAICHGGPGIEVFSINIGQKEDVFDGVVMTGNSIHEINKPELFGGPKKGGGVQGTLEFYEGTNLAGNAETSQYLADQVAGGVKNEMPAYPNLCHVVWRGPSSGSTNGALNGQLTMQTRIDKWAFRVRRYPLPAALTLTAGAERIGDDANPVCVMFEAMTDTVWGLGLAVSEIDVPAFNVAANQVALDGLGFSMVWATKKAIRDLIKECIRVLDGAFYQTSDGKLTLNLARAVAPTMTLDETNILKFTKFTRNAWNQTTNHIQIDFIDRDQKFKETSAAAQDLANFRLQGGVDTFQAHNYPGVFSKEVATFIAGRNLRQFSYPLATLELEVNREAHAIKPGDVVDINWPELGITGMKMRVMQVGLGRLEDGAITLYGAEDVFGLGGTVFSTPPNTNWSPVVVAPSDMLVTELVDVPQQLAGVDPTILQASPADTLDVEYRIMALGQTPGNGFEFKVWDRRDGSVDPFVVYDPFEWPDFLNEVQELGYTPTAGLPAVLHGYEGGSDTLATLPIGGTSSDFKGLTGIDDLAVAPNLVKTVSAADIKAGKSLIFMTDGAGREEYMAYTTLTDNEDGTFELGTVYRGLLDTAPWTWPVGQKMWFIGEALDIAVADVGSTPDPADNRMTRRISAAINPIPSERTRDIRFAQFTTGGTLEAEDAAEQNHTIQNTTSTLTARGSTPGTVGNVDISIVENGVGTLPGTPTFVADSDSLVAGATRKIISGTGLTNSIDLRLRFDYRERVLQGSPEIWLPGDAADALNATESTSDPLDPFIGGGTGLTPFRRLHILVEGINGGTTILASTEIDLATLTPGSVDFLALPASGVSNSGTIRVTLTNRRYETGSSIYSSEQPYVCVFERSE